MDIMPAHSGHNVQQTERTEVVIDPESKKPTLYESQDAGDSKLTSTSVHFGHNVQNGLRRLSILDIVSKMGGVGSGDVTECGICGLPWTADTDRHRTAVRRGMREFICDECREAQVAAVGGIEALDTS